MCKGKLHPSFVACLLYDRDLQKTENRLVLGFRFSYREKEVDYALSNEL